MIGKRTLVDLKLNERTYLSSERKGFARFPKIKNIPDIERYSRCRWSEKKKAKSLVKRNKIVKKIT